MANFLPDKYIWWVRFTSDTGTLQQRVTVYRPTIPSAAHRAELVDCLGGLHVLQHLFLESVSVQETPMTWPSELVKERPLRAGNDHPLALTHSSLWPRTPTADSRRRNVHWAHSVTSVCCWELSQTFDEHRVTFHTKSFESVKDLGPLLRDLWTRLLVSPVIGSRREECWDMERAGRPL